MFPKLLSHAMVMIVAALLVDFLYYVLGAMPWARKFLPWYFWAKVVVFVAGYALLLYFLGKNTYAPRAW